MRIGFRWLERKRFQTADESEDREELGFYLLGLDDEVARRHTRQRLELVMGAGGEVA